MKSKSIVLSLLGIIAIFCAALYGFNAMNKNVNSPKDIVYTSIVVENKPFYAFIPAKYFEKEFTLTTSGGKTVTPSFEWQDNSILKIAPLATGNYTLSVQEDNNKNIKKIDFEVKSIPEQAENKQQLQDYFRSIKELKAVLAAPFTSANTGLFNQVTEESQSVSSMSDTATETTSGGDQSTSANHSETNNQVAGIEEGDIAVSNGQYVFTVRDEDLVIIQPNPLEQVATLPMPKEHYIEKLFTYKNYLIVQSNDYTNIPEKTAIQIYDVSNPENATIVHTFEQDGYSSDSRVLDDTLYLLSSYHVMDESEMIPSTSTNDDKALIATKDIMIYPQTMSEQYTVISKVNLTDFNVETKAFLGTTGELYMSQHAIYMAAPEWLPISIMMPEPAMAGDSLTSSIDRAGGETTIIKYDITNSIEKTAETKVKGTLLNQFSMDEHNGYFRVATTVGNANINDPTRNSDNMITIFDEQLQEVGKLDNLARGERIYSARFMGDKAYIVTFVETDPLFVLNLQDPTNPIVEGELKIPGYSNYLHPVGEHHLLGIGYDTIVKSDGKNKFVENLGIKLSLFNVKDPANPIEQDVEILGGAGTSSSINYSHKGLYRDVVYNRYGFDVSIYNSHVYQGTGAVFYEVTPAGIAQPQLMIEKAAGEQYEDWSHTVKRILYVNDRTLIIRNNSVQALNRVTLQPIESIDLK